MTLSSEYIRAVRSKSDLSVVMFDIDHFKKFNDTHGHDQGDRVLQMVSRCLQEAVRPFDFPCRYGGEEYVAILPGMAVSDAAQLAERLRALVAETEVDGLHVHISLGVATLSMLKVTKAEALIEAADAALYRAKESGRNRVVVVDATL
jgi:diguanylate cyclase (GGDEF)-like protein